MDIKCRNCGEPWDHDTIHDVASEKNSDYETVAADFRRRGCEAFDTNHNGNKAHVAIGALTDMLGGDMDGLGAMIEDFGL